MEGKAGKVKKKITKKTSVQEPRGGEKQQNIKTCSPFPEINLGGCGLGV